MEFFMPLGPGQSYGLIEGATILVLYTVIYLVKKARLKANNNGWLLTKRQAVKEYFALCFNYANPCGIVFIA
jgi:hypothetical protein